MKRRIAKKVLNNRFKLNYKDGTINKAWNCLTLDESLKHMRSIFKHLQNINRPIQTARQRRLDLRRAYDSGLLKPLEGKIIYCNAKPTEDTFKDLKELYDSSKSFVVDDLEHS